MTKDLKSMRYALENAGTLQYYFNMIQCVEEEDGFWELYVQKETIGGRRNKKYAGTYRIYAQFCHEQFGLTQYDEEIPKWVYKFLIKGRKLRSGLGSPMARYYGWRALERMG